MNKKSAIFLLVLLVAGGGYYYYRTQLSCSFLRQKKVTINEKEWDVAPRDSLDKRGLSMRMIPNGRNAAVLYCKATNVGVKPEGRADEAMDRVLSGAWVTDRAFTRWFDKNKECLALVHKAARKPDCQFPILGKGRELIAGIMFPHLQTMRAFARFLVCEGRYYEYKRDRSKALESYLTIHRLAEHICQSDRFMISALVAIACHHIGSKAAEMWLANGKATEEELRTVIDHYQHALSSRPCMTDVLSSERRMTDEMLEDAVRDPAQTARAYADLVAVAPAELARVLEQYRRNPEEMSRAVDRLWRAFEAWCKLPAWQALHPSRSWEAYIERTPQLRFLDALMTKTLARGKTVFARCEAELGGVAIFAAIKLYEKENGRPPQSLSELKGKYIRSLPKDPFSGRDYVYKVRGSDWILYSVWDNLTDDGGAGSWPHKFSQDKDFIWRNTKIAVD